MMLSGVSEAAGPSWASGFPKLAKKNALLQWNPVKGATEYKVYRSAEKDKNLKVVATVKANRHIDKGIPAGATLYYYVTAVAGGKEGERSEAGKISTEKEKVFVALKVPKLTAAHVKDQPGGGAAVGLRWEGVAGTDLVAVNIYRSKTKGKDYTMVGSSASDMYEDKDVKRGESYHYVVTAVDNQFKETGYSNELSVEVAKPVEAAVKETEKAGKVQPTTMRPAKLLFRIPAETDARWRDAEEYKLEGAQDVAVDEAVGHIYVISSGYGGVLVYDMDGKLQFGIRKDGVAGTVKFGNAKGIAVGERGNIYVTDYNGPDISAFDFTGRPLETFSVDVSDIVPKRANLYGIAMDQDGGVYVTDPVSNSILVLDEKRKRRVKIVGARTEDQKKKEKDKELFNGPTSLTLTKDGDIVFVDSGWVKLLEFSPDGRFKRTIGKLGINAGELDMPSGLATGNKGEVFIASAGSSNIQAFSPDGKFLYALCNEKGDGPVDIVTGRGIYIDGADRLYVTEGNEPSRVSVFQMLDKTLEIIPVK